MAEKLKVNIRIKKVQIIMWQKQLKTTLQDVLGQLLKYGVAWNGLTPMILAARTRSPVFASALRTALRCASVRSVRIMLPLGYCFIDYSYCFIS